jgi:protein-S-isoprenylcysteine O-methyltransferase Ste14
MLIFFFVMWGLDYFSFFIFGYFTVIFQALTFPLLFAGVILFLCLSFYLTLESHKAVLEQVNDSPQVVDSGMYAWVRHPMYLETLLFCLAFIFINVSLVSIAIWVAFFIFYDKMAFYEKKSLIGILGEAYIAYQKQVSKWLPKVW